MADPYPKSKQLARGERRYRRKVASRKQWQAIIAAKGDVCRLDPGLRNSGHDGPIQYHHVVPRDLHGDDLADNIVPLCQACHERITNGNKVVTDLLALALTDAERAYVDSKGARGRLFGV
jgi:hypothetical protein